MITLKRYDMFDDIHKVAWNTFNAGAKNGIFMFDRDFMDYHADRFNDNSLMFYENDKLIALLPLNLKEISKSNTLESNTRKNETQNLDSKNSQDSIYKKQETQKILYSHEGLTFGGFIIDSNMRQVKMLECFALLREYMKAHKIDKLIYKSLPYIYHKSPADEDIYALFRNNARVFRVDCASVIGLDSKFKMNDLRKRCIKKAIKNDIKIIESNDFHNFVNLLNNVLQERHNTTAVHNCDELSLLHSRFSDNIRLFSATLQGQMIAAALIFNYENLVHTQYLCANALGRELGGLDLLLKTLIDSYLDSKMYFDFGISNENNGLFLNEGLIAQKESFGARSIAYNTFEMLVSDTHGGGGVRLSFYFFYFKVFRYFLFQKVINFLILNHIKLHFTQGEKYDYPA